MASTQNVPQSNQTSEDCASGHCWICLSDDMGDLISPCACKGSIGKVHETCLLTYLAHKCQECCATGDPSCPNCNTKYHLLLDTAASEAGGSYDKENVDEEAMELRGFARVRKVFELIQTMAQGEERTSMVRDYSMHVLVQIISVVCLASCGYGMLMYLIQYNRGKLAPCPNSTQASTVSMLQLLLSLAGWPTSLDHSSAEKPPHPKLTCVAEGGASEAWSLVFTWLQYVTCARALFFSFTMCSLADTLTPWLPCLPTALGDKALDLFKHANRLRQFIVRDQEEESRVLDFFVWLGLPLASMSIRNIFARFAEILLACDILPTVSWAIEYAVCNIWSSYTVVLITVLCDVLFLTRRTADLFDAAGEDLGRFRVKSLCKQLQMGRVRVFDRACQQ